MSNSNLIDNLFDKFLSSQPIISEHRVLSSSFIPENLPHRNKQIEDLASILVRCLRGAPPSNIFIYGKPGSGKTCVSKLVLNKLNERMNNDSSELNLKFAFINCKEYSTSYAVYTAISHNLQKDQEQKNTIPPTGLPTSEVFHRLATQIDGYTNSIIIVILDEIDELIKKSGSEVLYNLTRINTNLSKSSVSVIGISNDTKFKDYLDPRVYSSLSEEEIVFTPYKANELIDILEERANEALYKKVLSEGVINKIAAMAARDHGDARRAIDLLRVSAELTERQGNKKIEIKHVEEAKGHIEKNIVFEVANSLPLHSKFVLAAIYALNSREGYEITTGQVYKLYSEFCKINGLEVVTSRRVSDYLNEQDQLGLIDTNTVSLGRYGRTKYISLTVQSAIIREVIEKDQHTSFTLMEGNLLPIREKGLITYFK
ncbi:MAG: Cdc6/Cdc18 family protein [Candidatus Hodarchaeales archaeon]|jgi:cell division control protein 6